MFTAEGRQQPGSPADELMTLNGHSIRYRALHNNYDE